MRFDLILRVVTKLIIPFTLLFGLYVHFHGELGPGGGFQAGVIGSAVIILYALMFGLNRAQHVMPPEVIEFLVPLGVLIYAGTGVVGMLLGGNYLEYNMLAHDSQHGQELGVILVEVGVLVTVFSTMTAIFYAFAGRGRT